MNRHLHFFAGIAATTACVFAQSEPGTVADQAPRPITRYIVKLAGGVRHTLPCGERERGLPLVERAILHDLDVDRRTRECQMAVAGLQPTLVRLGAQIVFELPMFQAVVVDCPTARVAELRAAPIVAGVFEDGIARSMTLPPRPPTDPRPSEVEHHRAAIAHQNGFTGAGSSAWAPVAAVLDAWLLGEFNGITRHHAAVHMNGDASLPTRVLANLDWAATPTPFPARPLPAPTVFGFGNLYHGPGMAGALAGSAVTAPGLMAFSNGHAPAAGLVSINITSLIPAQTVPTCSGITPDPQGFWAYQSQVLGGLNEAAAKRFTYTGTSQPTRPISVVNLSYGGPTNPTHPVNDAMRQLAFDHDILVVTAAGNSGTRIFESFYNLNGIAVGSFEMWRFGAGAAWSRVVSPFSTVGPQRPAGTCFWGAGPFFFTGPCWCLAGGDASATWDHPNGNFQRSFPDLGAIGGLQRVLLQDSETVADFRDGTSIAATHVSGAALLFSAGVTGQPPSVIPTALETRAVLLATAENTTTSGNGNNASGAGFLRTDRATAARAISELSFATVSLATSVGNTESVGQVNVAGGNRYAVALTWFADQSTVQVPAITAPNWPDVDLQLIMPDGTALPLGADPTGNRTWERLEFVAPADGGVKIEAVVQRLPGTPVPLVLAFATCRTDAPGSPPASIASSPSASPTTTCGVMQGSAGGLAAILSTPGLPAHANQTAESLRSLEGMALPVPEGRWLAMRVDGATSSQGSAFNCQSTPSNGINGMISVARVELQTNSPAAFLVPCALLPSGTSWSSSPPPPSTPPTDNRWNGWLRIPAGAGTAVAEFRAEVNPQAALTSRIRWFAAQFPPDVIVGTRRWINQPGPGNCTVGAPWVALSSMWALSSDASGQTWGGVGVGLFFNMNIFASGSLVAGQPQMQAVGPPSLTSGAIEFLLTGNEQGNPLASTLGVLLIDLVPGEGPDVQLLDPAVNGTCVSLFKLSSTVANWYLDAFPANVSNGTQLNIGVASSGRISMPVTPSPLMLGLPIWLQGVTTAASGQLLVLRPTNLVVATFGL